MPEGKELKYKTSRVSYTPNYILVLLLLFFLTLVLPSTELLPLNLAPLSSELATIVIVLAALVLVFEPETERVMRQYMVTNNEVVKIEGILVKKSFAIPYQSVADVRVIKGVIGRIFNYGDVDVKGLKDDILMKGMREPEVLYKIIKNKIALMKRPMKRDAKVEKTDKE